jgi:hypothetical protein
MNLEAGCDFAKSILFVALPSLGMVLLNRNASLARFDFVLSRAAQIHKT